MKEIDVAIVGAGVSGLYAGWRLAHAPQRPRIRVYEASDRIGGRLFTVRIGRSSRRVELGAMRYPTSHKLIGELLSELGVAVEPFPNLELRRMYFRGQFCDVDARGTVYGAIPFRLSTRAPSPFALLANVILRIEPRALEFTEEDWRRWRAKGRIRGFERHEIWRLGFWNVVNEFVSKEDFNFMRAGVGIESMLSNWNAGLALELLSRLLWDFNQEEFKRPTSGWSRLADALAASMRRVSRRAIELRHRLVTLQHDPGADFPMRLVFETQGRPVEVRARKVVLAMPRKALELLTSDLFRDHPLMGQLRRVARIPAFRLYLDYEEPWWQAEQYGGWETGFAVTDLPLRQVYYGTALGGTKSGRRSMLMASYADAHTVQFWNALANLRRPPATPSSPWPEGHFCRGRRAWSRSRHGKVVPTAVRQLRELHEVSPAVRAPEPEWIGYCDWTVDPYGGGWHAWRPGYNVDETIPEMRAPIPGVPLHICGEAYSRLQGFVEGALTTTEKLLQEEFGLERPRWLPADYDLGP